MERKPVENGYSIDIKKGHSPINDAIVEFLKYQVRGNVLDVGCNSGYLLDELRQSFSAARYTGIDASMQMVQLARAKGLDVWQASATDLPYDDQSFDTVVLSCILEQIPDWKAAVSEARRVGRRVIGINPYPGSPWGVIQGFVKSVIFPEEIQMLGGTVERFDNDRYYFEFV